MSKDNLPVTVLNRAAMELLLSNISSNRPSIVERFVQWVLFKRFMREHNSISHKNGNCIFRIFGWRKNLPLPVWEEFYKTSVADEKEIATISARAEVESKVMTFYHLHMAALSPEVYGKEFHIKSSQLKNIVEQMMRQTPFSLEELDDIYRKEFWW